MPVVAAKARRDAGAYERQLRIDLAAAFRLAAQMGWHEAVANHFSVAVSEDGRKFLMNPRWRHFSLVRASELLLLDVDDKETMSRRDAPDATAWCIHSHLHASVPHARCILHLHPKYATAIAALADPEIKPVDQNTARFYNRCAIDLQFGGIADFDEEGARLARALGNKSSIMLGNHGVLVVANTIAEAFDDLYYLERACQTLLLAYSSGQKLNLMSPEIAEETAVAWEDYKESAFSHFEQLKLMLDRQDPSYAE